MEASYDIKVMTIITSSDNEIRAGIKVICSGKPDRRERGPGDSDKTTY